MVKNFEDLGLPESDLETVDTVFSHLHENYADYHGEGPVCLTGSAVYGDEPEDYDVVVVREDRELYPEADYHAVIDLLKEFNGDENERRDSDLYPVNTLQRELGARVWPTKNSSKPVTRVEATIDETEFDFVFSDSLPGSDYIVYNHHSHTESAG